MRSLDEYRKLKPSLQRVPKHDPRPIAQELVRLSAVTNDPSWDYYNRYIEAAISQSVSDREHLVLKMRNPMLVSTDEILSLKAQITSVDSRISTLEEVLMLPKILKENGEQAKKIISDIDSAV